MQTITQLTLWRRRALSFGALAMAAVMAVSVTSCTEDEGDKTPTISYINPTEAEVGSTITIGGTNLESATEVKFNGTSATIDSKTDNEIKVKVPAGASDGKVTVKTSAGEATSAASFTVVIPEPTITSFAPLTGSIGTDVTITGTNLDKVTAVKFGNVAGTIKSQNATTLVTTVPTGAISGKITITAATGDVVSEASFTVPAPKITSFSPEVAVAGSDVTITGTDLDQVTSVKIGSTEATIKSQTATSLVATVPDGATTGALSISNGTATSTAVSFFAVGDINVIKISDFEEDNAADIWGTAQDAGDLAVNEIETEDGNTFYHEKAKDNNGNYWVGGRYFEHGPDQPFGVEESDKTAVWMNVDVRSHVAKSVGKLVYTVVEAGAGDNRRNYERDFDVTWSDWKTISIRVDKFGYWNGAGMTSAVDGGADVPTIWSVALYVQGGNTTDTYDLDYDNLRFSEGGPLGEELEGHH